MPAKKAAKKVAARKEAPVKKAAKKSAKKTASKTPPAEAAPEPVDLETAAYFNYLSRVEKGLPHDPVADWLEAEKSKES